MGIYPNDLPKLNLGQKADSVLQTFRDHGLIGAGTGNRVVQICQHVTRLADRETNPGESGYEELVQALKDVNEWWLILEILGASLFEPPYADRFRRSLADTVLPDPNASQSQGRDSQFELFIAAIAKRAGFLVK